MLASHHNNYDIIKILLEYGARIEDPEYYAFSTQTQTLQHSLGMLNIYRALASQAYISLTSADPIHTAFEMCVKLRKLSMKNPEFSEQFQELAGQCEQFAADILGHIRNHKEQTCILYHDPYLWGAYVEGNGVGPYKVKIAIHYEQRKVGSHCNTDSNTMIEKVARLTSLQASVWWHVPLRPTTVQIKYEGPQNSK